MIAARDHPRACGEQPNDDNATYSMEGSSPRVRGAVTNRLVDRHKFGIIPARAGSRSRTGASTSSTRDHPRACGEQAGAWRLAYPDEGSSPRVRGAVEGFMLKDSRFGIIPARAGSS